MNGDLLLHMGLPLLAAVLVAVVLLPFRRRAGLGRVLRPLLVVIAVANLVLVAYLWTRQVDFPLNLDLMEGTVLQHVQRAASGMAIYTAPAPEFVALAYNPLYYELGAAVGRVTGVSLPMLRLLSMLAATLSALIIFVVVREKTGSAWWGVVAAGLFAAAYDVMECYFATAHSDAWFLCAALAGTLVLDRTRSRLGSMAGIAILVASFWFKQHGALFVIGGLGYLSLRDGLRELAGVGRGGRPRTGHLRGRGAVALRAVLPLLHLAGPAAVGHGASPPLHAAVRRLRRAVLPRARGGEPRQPGAAAGAARTPGACSWSTPSCRVAWGRWIAGPPRTSSSRWARSSFSSARSGWPSGDARQRRRSCRRSRSCWRSSRWRTTRAP